MLNKARKLGDLADVLARLEREWQPKPQRPGHKPGLADRYVAYLAESLLELKDAARHRDLEAVRRIGHRLRGTAIHFGYGGIGASAGELGEAITTKDEAKIDLAIEVLTERLSDVAAKGVATSS